LIKKRHFLSERHKGLPNERKVEEKPNKNGGSGSGRWGKRREFS